jgi:hypothetical protein
LCNETFSIVSLFIYGPEWYADSITNLGWYSFDILFGLIEVFNMIMCEYGWM